MAGHGRCLHPDCPGFDPGSVALALGDPHAEFEHPSAVDAPRRAAIRPVWTIAVRAKVIVWDCDQVSSTADGLDIEVRTELPELADIDSSDVRSIAECVRSAIVGCEGDGIMTCCAEVEEDLQRSVLGWRQALHQFDADGGAGSIALKSFKA